MRSAAIDDAAPAATVGRAARPGARGTVVLASVGLLVLALALRLTRYRSAYDVFIDESIYSGIADNIVNGRGLTFEGQVGFYLHPPLLFLLDSIWLRVVGAAGADPVTQVFAARIVSCVFGAANALLLMTVVRRLVGLRAGLLVGVAYAVEPFVIRFDSRVFLETATMTWLLAGLLVLLPRAAGSAAGGRGRCVAGGVLFGLAALTKEPSAVLFGVPLLVCLLRARPLPRGDAAIVLGAAVVTYLPYPVIATAVDGSQWVDQKTTGVQRLLGLVQVTGFNAQGSPSFLGRLIAQLPFFGTTYAVIGLGLLAGVWLLRFRPAPQQLLALWGLAAFALLVYQVAVGTLEEQMFYFLVVPALATVGTAVGGLERRQLPLHLPAAVPVLALCLYLGVSSAVWTRVHTTRDTAVADTVAWLDRHAPNGGKVLALADGVQLVLPRYEVITSPAFAAAPGAWVVTSSLQVDQGYGFARRPDMATLRRTATPMFRSSGRSMGQLTVWRLPG